MKKLFVAFIILLASLTVQAQEPAWKPPIGIPMLSFGITESVSDEVYTHWVDNTKPCSNASAGTPANPRCAIPTTALPPGSIVQIRGGPYDYAGSGGTTWRPSGSAEAPVYYRGPVNGPYPAIRNVGRVQIIGSYGIVEYLDIQSRFIGDAANHHIAIRHTEVHGHPAYGCVALSGLDAVLWQNHIHHCQGDDRHGIGITAGSQRIWILENDVHHNGGDGFQSCHGVACSANPPTNVYIGRNRFHSDRENCIDLKWLTNVVVSQNECFGYRAAPKGPFTFDDGTDGGGISYSSGSDGSAIVIGSDGGPTNAWLIGNLIYNSVNGIRHETSCVGAVCSSGTGPAYTIGNVLHTLTGHAFILEKHLGTWFVEQNTVDQIGGNGLHYAFGTGKEVHFQYNRLSRIGGRPIYVPTPHPNAVVSFNVFGPAPITLTWNTSTVTYHTTADLQTFPSGSGNVIADTSLP